MVEEAMRKIEYCCQPENRMTYSRLEKKYGIKNLYTRRKRSLLMQMYGQSKEEINLVKNSCDGDIIFHSGFFITTQNSIT